jgi:hypothetical protein
MNRLRASTLAMMPKGQLIIYIGAPADRPAEDTLQASEQ